MDSINNEETLLDYPKSEFPKVYEAQENLKPFEELWFMIRDRSEKLTNWKNKKPIQTLDSEEMEKEIKQMF